jgi:hypothetical protein
MDTPTRTAAKQAYSNADKKYWANKIKGPTPSITDLGKRISGHPMSKSEIADYLMKLHQIEGSSAEELLDNNRYSKYAAKGSFD